MAKHTLTITDYKITRFGYFKKFAQKNPKLFCDLDTTLKELIKWISNKSLLDTKTYEGNSNVLPTYLMNIVTNKNDYLICIWNESHMTGGNVLSVPLNSPVGSPKISSASIPPGSVPGYPTYFWLKPAQNEFSTVQFSGELNGRNNLELYMESFLAKFNPTHVRSTQTPDIDAEFHKEIVGYSKTPNISEPVVDYEDISTEFKSVLIRDPSQTSEINALAKDIYGLVRKEEVTGAASAKTSLLGMMINQLGINTVDSHTSSMKYRVKYEVNFKPSESELKQIMENWEDDESNKWDNIGFKVSGRPSPVWIDSSISRAKHDIEVQITDHAVNCLALLIELHKI